MRKALAMIEYSTVSSGMLATDTVVKSGDVELIIAKTISPGKFIVMFSGELSSIKESIDISTRKFGDKMLDSFVLGSPHEKVYEAIGKRRSVEKIDAIGIVETFTISTAILAADSISKTAIVELMEIKIDNSMFGKSYVLFTGTVANVNEAVESIINNMRIDGFVLDYAVISNPDKKFYNML